MEKPGTVVLADIDVLVTAYLADLLERHGYHARIAPPLHAAVRDWIRKYDAELCIIDLVLRDGHDVGIIERLATQSPSTKIVIRTADTSSDVMRSLRVPQAMCTSLAARSNYWRPWPGSPTARSWSRAPSTGRSRRARASRPSFTGSSRH